MVELTDYLEKEIGDIEVVLEADVAASQQLPAIYGYVLMELPPFIVSLQYLDHNLRQIPLVMERVQ